jgi:hypothetical protein
MQAAATAWVLQSSRPVRRSVSVRVGWRREWSMREAMRGRERGVVSGWGIVGCWGGLKVVCCK